ncbi:hypothetical protein ASE17_18380 [Phenylobacterium sp. Root77]|uniref:cysteine desulfurase family protein n=1 Tax=unclassified Phenylobacterium TaxID=2640670 RepID=UPI0006F70FCE|nr:MULTISPECIES: cysteine desulfurase family protein [unclassified Phenylobacterium]KQW70830.1 hypothetical protein ASC73_12250 [Phenylobacterium sp. Root1277]KQW90747.1 hypothetical protein ASC79_15340 [Phenylobacterium sp. Root1290]KRC39620.1 hypothetical protein ASE17_18380 [Phenylobacterium sp. Root77]
MTAAPIYLDGFATLPLAPEARDAMLAAWSTPGNAGSANLAGETAAATVAAGRTAVAALIGAAPSEVVFTSGATEANNLALIGVARALHDAQPNRRRIVISAIEHKSVLESAASLQRAGFEVVLSPVDEAGRLDLVAFGNLMDGSVLLASVMLVNNETGGIQPVREAAALAHAADVLFHCDAAQAAGKIPVDVADLDVDYLSLSAHKLYGPMGVGALYISAGAPLPAPLIFGGGQQAGLRPGTEPVALIAGFGAAARLAESHLASSESYGRAMATALHTGLSQRQLRSRIITHGHPVVPGSLALSLQNVDADALCSAVAKFVSMSTGSACTSGQLNSSHVLRAMGLADIDARSVVRLFCHRYLEYHEIERAVDLIVLAAGRSRLATGEVRQ